MVLVRNLADPRFGALFADFTVSAFRLETLQHYDVSYEEGPYRDFLDGVPRYTHPDQAAYASLVSSKVQAGKSMSRVHVVRLPLSSYVRFELTWPYVDSVAAGEDVRILPIADGQWPEDVPQLDFWLFDSSVAALMRYAETGEFLEAEITEEEAIIRECLRWRDASLRGSLAYAEFMSSVCAR